MRFSLKTRQVVAVTSIVGLAVVVLGGLYVTGVARVRLEESRSRGQFLANAIYQRTRQAWRAAISRYEGVLSEYPDFARTDEVLYRISECLVASGRTAEALPHLNRLRDAYPSSAFADEAAKLTATIPVAPPPAVVPSPSPTPSPEG